MGVSAKPRPPSAERAAEPAAILAQAAATLRQGDPRKSAALCATVIDREPDNGRARYLRGLALRAMRDFAGARECFDAAIANGFTDAVAHLEQGRTLILLGDRQAAETQYRAALAAKPDLTAACRELGSLSLEAGRANEAEPLFRDAIRLDPDDGIARRNLAFTLHRLGRTAEAIATLEEAATRAPDQADLHVMLATLYELENDVAAAQRHAETAHALDAGNGSASIVLAKLALRRGDAAGALDRLDAIDAARLSQAQHVTSEAERGRALDRLGRYEQAFAAYRRSRGMLSRLQANMPSLDFATRAARMSAMEDGLSRARWDRLALHHAADYDGPQPIFVLGFMRSGTTLIERILGAHPAIAPLGELTLIADAADALREEFDGGFPDGLFCLDSAPARDILAAQRQRYLAAVRDRLEEPGAVRFIVDKAPFNTEHIGLVRLLFPDAPVIHAVRHPLDTVLSSFFVNFAEPQPWSFSLDTAAALFVRLHDHLRAMAPEPVGAVLPVRYEQLVADPGAAVHTMLDYVGVAWDEACLKFHEQAGGVRTASYAQVARPLYDTSVFRYRNYLPFIDAAVLDTLRPTVETLGYDYSP